MFRKIDAFWMLFAPEGAGGGGGDGGGSGGGAAAAAAAGADAGAAAGADGGFDWAGTLGDDYATYQPTIEGDKITDPKALFAAYGDLKTRADGMVAIPGDDATSEDLDAFYAKLGRPETPDKYDLSGFAPPEDLPWDGDAQTAMVAHLHEQRLTNTQVVGALGAYSQVYAKQHEARNALADRSAKDARAGLEKEFGGEFTAKDDLANRAVKEVFGEEIADAKQLRLEDGRFLLDHPGLWKAFLTLGERMAEGGSLGGGRATEDADGAMSEEDYMKKEVFKEGR